MKELSGLVEHAKNNKNHPQEQIDILKQNILKFGFTSPFLISGDCKIIAGHGRKLACDELGIKEVPCIIIDDLTEDEIKALRIADNRVGELGETNWAFVKEEWEELKDSGLDFLTGYKEEDFLDMIEEEQGEIEEDNFDAPDDINDIETDIKLGDVFKLGEHRLMCGSSTELKDVEVLMNGDKVDMIFTDPPYGINYSGGRTQVVNTKNYGKLKNDDLEDKELGNLICNIFKFNAKEIYICVSPIMQKPFLDFINDSNKKIDAIIVWDKKQPGLGYMAYRRQCEFILYVRDIPFKKGNNQDFDLWSISRDNGKDYVHGTQKPILVPARAIKNSSKQEQTVLDLFGGSGSTLIACEQLNRKCYMMELDEKYCQVIINRWEQLTNKKAEKIND